MRRWPTRLAGAVLVAVCGAAAAAGCAPRQTVDLPDQMVAAELAAARGHLVPAAVRP